MQYFGVSIVSTCNSVYRVDWDRHVVSGGNLDGEAPFTNGFCAEGERMRLYLNDRVLVTSTVVNVVQERSDRNARKQQKSLSRLFCFR